MPARRPRARTLTSRHASANCCSESNRSRGRGDPTAYLALLTENADRGRAGNFATAIFKPGATRVVFLQRERLTLTRTVTRTVAYRVIVDMFAEFGDSARVDTLQFEAEPRADGALADCRSGLAVIVEQAVRLSMNAHRQFEAQNFVVRAEDLDADARRRTVFRIDTAPGRPGWCCSAPATCASHPAPETEQGQVRIFAGDSARSMSRFDAAYLRSGEVGAMSICRS